MNYHAHLTRLAQLAWSHRRQTNFEFGYACMVMQGEQTIVLEHLTLDAILQCQLAKNAILLFVHPFADEKQLHILIATLAPKQIIFAFTFNKQYPLPNPVMIDDHSILEATWLKRYMQTLQRNQRPWITLSYGMSMDGKIATYTGDSKYITGPEGRQVVHTLRHQHHGILVGIQTVKTDHPLLTTRLDEQVGQDAQRIILDSTLAIDLSEKILTLDSKAKTYVVAKLGVDQHKINQLEKLGVQVLLDPTANKRIDLHWLMSALKQNGIDSILVEGGGTVHFSFIELGLVDMIVAQVSPLIIGGRDAKTPVEGQGFATLMQSKSFAFQRYWQVGSDIIIIACPL